jgi:hypothetical protein
LSSTTPRTAFYPCCANDIAVPRQLLQGLADEILFCDLRRPLAWGIQSRTDDPISIKFIQRSALEILKDLPPISVFFSRRDGDGEGGSGLYFLGEELFPQVIAKCRPEGAIVVTDGSNSSEGLFEKLICQEGFENWGWRFRPAKEQPWLQDYELHVIQANKLAL